jgi:hypothetical protein
MVPTEPYLDRPPPPGSLFKVAYEIGHEVGNEELEHLLLDARGKAPEVRGVWLNSLREFDQHRACLIKALAKVFNAGRANGLHIQVMELSLFDPNDGGGSRFYSIVCGRRLEALECFQVVGQESIAQAKKQGPEGDRGPVVSNPRLYDPRCFPRRGQQSRPYHLVVERRSELTPDESQEWQVLAGSYDLEEDFESERVEDHVKAFCQALHKALSDAAAAVVDTSVFIPLLRPAGTASSGSASWSALKGGVLHLVAHRDEGLEGEVLDRAVLGLIAELKEHLHAEAMAIGHTNAQLEWARQEARHGEWDMFAHQTDGLLEFIWRESHRLPDRHRCALWHVLATVQINSSKGRFDMHRSLAYGPEARFPELATKKPEEIAEHMLRLALYHALERALSNPPANDSVGHATRKIALELVDAPDAAAEFARRLQRTIDIAEWPDWVPTQGFAVALHHTVWQAAYHALRASAAGMAGPLLVIRVEGNRVITSNRPEDPTMAAPGRADQRFFERINHHTDGVYHIQGPVMESDTDGSWCRTTITRRGTP